MSMSMTKFWMLIWTMKVIQLNQSEAMVLMKIAKKIMMQKIMMLKIMVQKMSPKNLMLKIMM